MPPPQPRSATVLIVEDEPAVRDLLVLALEAPGRRLLTADNGVDALAVAGDKPLDLLVTDVLVPGLDGPRLAATLRERRPTLPVLYLSGAYDQENFPELPRGALLRKPFSLAELRATVEGLLGAR